MEFATDINNVMYAYIDRKKKFPVTTLLRAIGYDTDKAILNIFDLADEIEATREGLEKSSAANWLPGYSKAGRKTS
jgi:DNA-directed RNA polymerase subunit beta